MPILKRWWKTKEELNEIRVQESIKVIVSEFTQKQLKFLETTNLSGETCSFGQMLFIQNRKKTPLLKRPESYAIHAKTNVESFQHMFDQEENWLAVRVLFLNVFNGLFD